MIQAGKIDHNISDSGVYGVFENGVASGTLALTTYLTKYVCNVISLLNSSGTDNEVAAYSTGIYWNNIAAIDFTSATGTDPNLSGNFQHTSRSPYHRAGTGGKDVGAWDWTCLNAETAAALAGNYTASFSCGPLGPVTTGSSISNVISIKRAIIQ